MFASPRGSSPRSAARTAWRSDAPGLGRFLGAVAGSPYERLLKELERIQERNEEDDAQLAKEVLRFTKMVMKQYEDDRIDEEEHDLIIEAAEEADPNGRSFTKLGEDGDEFYDMDAMPSGALLEAREERRSRRSASIEGGLLHRDLRQGRVRRIQGSNDGVLLRRFG